MPLQSRVSPFGELFATPARGLLMGNRGGRLHDDRKQLTARRWTSKQWICCKLAFNNRHRTVWGDSYTELFFLDEVTAFAAGHRPCFECRREDAVQFAILFADATNAAHSHASGNAALGRRRKSAVADLRTIGGRHRVNPMSARGNEREHRRAGAAEIDRVLHAERLDGKQKRLHRLPIETLPDGAMIARGPDAFALRRGQLWPWTAAGYGEPRPRPSAGDVGVLTPPAILAVLARGYLPQWHPSAA